MDDSRSGVPQMTSDGKRMRVVWKPGDGDGDSSTYLVERSINILKGHPTWKLFMGDVALPVARGSKDEPPHYVYLDDRACYYIYMSKTYNKNELKMFWPFDFNNQGVIKQGRKNRGRVAYLDDSCAEIAKGSLRGKDKWYEFSGDPEVVAYYAIRPKKAHVEHQVAAELAEIDPGGSDAKDDQYAAPPTITPAEASVPNMNTPRPSRPTARPTARPLRPLLKGVPLEVAEALRPTKAPPRRPTVPVQNISHIYPHMLTARPTPSTAPSTNNLYPPRPTPPTSVMTPLRFGSAFLSSSFRPDTLFRYGPKVIPKPVALPPRAIHGSPYGTINPVSNFRSTPRAVSGDLANVLGSSPPRLLIEHPAPKRNWSERNPVPEEVPKPVDDGASAPVAEEAPTPVVKEPTNPTNTPTMKRTFIMPFDISSSDTGSSPATPPAKRIQTASPSVPDMSGRQPSFGGDGANDYGGRTDSFDLTAASSDTSLRERAVVLQLRTRLKATKQVNEQHVQDKEAQRLHIDMITKERDQFRKVIVMILASRESQYVELRKRISALQKFSDELQRMKDTVIIMSDTAKKEIEPTIALSEGLDTILDEPGKHMYNMGMDEEWKALQEEAWKLNEAPNYPPQ